MEVINFQSGVIIQIKEDIISTNDNDCSILISEIENVQSTECSKPEIQETFLFARFECIIILITIIGFISPVPYAGFVGFMIFMITTIAFMVDLFLQLGICTFFVKKYFTTNFYAVTLTSSSGNNIIFNANLEDKKNIEKLREKFSLLRAKRENSSSSKMSSKSNDNVLDNLNKLGELLEKGILTKEEFDTKKKELLKL